MNLINDLGNDLAVAFLIERRHSQKLDSREAIDLISHIKAALERIASNEQGAGPEPLESNRMTAH